MLESEYAMQIVTGVLISSKDFENFVSLALRSPGFQNDKYGKHVLLMFDFEYDQIEKKKNDSFSFVKVATLGSLNASQTTIQCAIKLLRWFKIASVRYSNAEFIGWQDSDTWVAFPRLYSFLTAIPHHDRDSAYVGLPQYMRSRVAYGNSFLPTFSNFTWSCRPGSLFFTQGMLTYLGKGLATSVGTMERFLRYQSSSTRKGSKCVAAGDVTSGYFISKNPFVSQVKIYATYSLFDVWPHYASYKSQRNVAVHFLHRTNMKHNADYFLNRTRHAMFSRPIGWSCKPECSNASWTNCQPRFNVSAESSRNKF